MKKTSLILTATLFALLLSLPFKAQAAEPFSLFTEEEAKDLNFGDDEWAEATAPKSLTIGVGPQILFESPQVEETDKGLTIISASELNLLVLFKGDIAPVDMNTLDIVASKGWFSKNLTKRLKPFLNGTSIKAENIRIPSGRFKLEITISDKDGHESVQEYLCDIQE